MVAVREATAADVPAIRTVASDAWHAAYDQILGRETVDETLERWYDPERLELDIEEEAVVVAERSDTVVGFAHTGLTDEPGAYALKRLYVDPTHWGAGIGTVLLVRVETIAREAGASRLVLGVLADNERAVSFYEARGFECTERRESPLFSSVEDLLFEKSLV